MNCNSGIIYVVLISILLFQNCKTVDINPENYTKEKVYFGSGGGFTGELKEFCLLANGDVFQINPANRSSDLRKSIGKSSAKKIFKHIQSLHLNRYTYDQPGNMYFWMKHQSETDSSYLIWGGSGLIIDEKITLIYEQLVALTKQQ